MAKQMEAFKGYLEDFAAKHKDQIKKDSEFRVAFQEMCSTIGVDPLACKYYDIHILCCYYCFLYCMKVEIICNITTKDFL